MSARFFFFLVSILVLKTFIMTSTRLYYLGEV